MNSKNKKRSVFLGLVLLAGPVFLFSQEPQSPSAPIPTQNPQASQQLVAWSSVQKPKAVPEPLPPTEDSVPQPERQANSSAPAHADQQPLPADTSKTIKN
jgi:hypothetical protein